MKLKFIISATLIAATMSPATAQKPTEVAAYIATYKDLAIAEQKRTGVPAAIKLAQGIHESACGSSELSLNAKNHFGIKCKKTWEGATYTYTDDAKDECFRKYEDVQNSYRDHSDFLKGNVRYASLFTLDVNDYKSWAHGLKRCGYATNPKYAQRIIDLIEKYDLAQYNSAENSRANLGDYDDAQEIASTEANFSVAVSENTKQVTVAQQAQPDRIYYVLTQLNGKKGFYAKAGDLLLNAAYAHNIRYAKLLELNDLSDEPLPVDMFIYLEKKSKEGKLNTYTVKENQLLIEIAQEQGIRLKELKAYNHLLAHEEPAAGTELQLKGVAAKKPLLRGPIFGNSPNPDYEKKETKNTYVTGGAKSNKNTATPASNVGEHEATKVASEPKAIERSPVAQEVKQEEVFNIANEPAVEEQIAQERIAANVAATADSEEEDENEVELVEEEETMSDLERLKAKLDKSVYGNNSAKAEPSKSSSQPSVQVSHNAVQSYQTRPAAQQSYNAKANTNSAPTASASEQGGGQEALKRRIEQYQNSKPSNASVATVARESAPIAAGKTNPVGNSKSMHVVKRGETAYSIANQYGLTVNELIKLNKLASNGTVQLGQSLKVK